MVATVKCDTITEASNTGTANLSLSSTGNVTVGNNLTLSGSGARFLGDFTNATVTNRLSFQTSTTNSSTGIYALPNGSSTAASWQATNNADPTNASKVLIATNGSTDVQLVSGRNGSGTYLPLSFYTNNTQNAQLDTSGNLTTVGTVNMGSSFLRNRIINGAMQIWQRATAPAAASLASFTYNSVDRWSFYSGSTSSTQSQNTSVPTGFQYSLKVQRTAASTGTSQLYAQQIIETVNCVDLAGQSVTLSFYAKSGANFSASGNLITAQVNTGTVADQGGNSGAWTGAASPINTTQAITTTWTRYSFTGTIASNVLEIAPVFGFTPTGTAGADDSFYITGVQLEVGSIATPFERRLYGQELALCQRYYFRYVTGAQGYSNFGLGYASSTTNAYIQIKNPVPMRIPATSLDLSAASTFSYNYGTSPTLVGNALGIDYTVLQLTGSGMANGYAVPLFGNNNTNAYVGVSAEL